MVYTGSYDGLIRSWDLETKQCAPFLSFATATRSHMAPAGTLSKNVLEPVVCIDLHCSNTRLAVGHRAGSFSCWNARVDASGKIEDLIMEAKHSARKLDSSVIKFNHDGSYLAVGYHDCVIDVCVRC